MVSEVCPERDPAMTALNSVAAATELRKRSEIEWKEALCAAVERHSYREVAKVAGVSYGRVAQIVRSAK